MRARLVVAREIALYLALYALSYACGLIALTIAVAQWPLTGYLHPHPFRAIAVNARHHASGRTP